MQNFVVIFFSITVIVCLIYFVYKIMLGSDGSDSEEDLQITSQEILAQANILFKQKKYNIVESLAKKYLEKKPSDNEIRTILAKSLYYSDKKSDAINQAKIILKNKPKNYAMKIFIANCYLESASPYKAISELMEVLEVDADNVVAIKLLAKVYFDTNQKKSAMKMYDKLDEFLYSNQEKATNKKLLAQIHREFLEYDLAIQEYKAVLELYPADIDVRKKTIEIYNETSDYALLIEAAEELLTLNSGDENDLWTIEKLTDAFVATQDYDKALEYATVLKEHPLSNKVHATEIIAKIFMATGQMDEGINILTALVDENSTDLHLKTTLAQSYEAKSDYDNAANVYKDILDEVGVTEIKDIHSKMSNLYANWGTYLYTQGDNEACFKKFTTAFQYDSQNSEIYYLLGIVNQSIKNFNEAIIQFKKAIALSDESSDYYFAIAECYEAIDSFYEEKSALLECIKLNPNNAKAQYRLAILFDSQRDSVSTMAFLRKAVELDDNLIEAKYKLALMLEGQGHKDESIELYETILLRNPEHHDAENNLKMLKESN